MNFNIKSPQTSTELLDLISAYQDKNFRFGAGYTDLLLELKKQPDDNLTIINLAQLTDELFTDILSSQGGIRIGALVTAGMIASDVELQRSFPVLSKAAVQLASRQIRQVATVGGNICTASPAGDISCALVALNARCEIIHINGTIRVIPITDFLTGVRKTALKRGEILRSVIIPHNNGNFKIISDFIKVGIRRSMECSVVSLAYHFLTDGDDKITKAGIAVGSVAPTIKYVKSACEFILEKSILTIRSSNAKKFAEKVIEYAHPISDIRASAWYRKEVLFNISRSIFED